MDVKDILTLCNAGFTAQQIAKLLEPEKPESEQGKPEPKPEKPEPKPEPADSLKQAMDEMKKMMQEMALSFAQQHKPNEEETVDQILASIINPPIRKEN